MKKYFILLTLLLFGGCDLTLNLQSRPFFEFEDVEIVPILDRLGTYYSISEDGVFTASEHQILKFDSITNTLIIYDVADGETNSSSKYYFTVFETDDENFTTLIQLYGTGVYKNHYMGISMLTNRDGSFINIHLQADDSSEVVSIVQSKDSYEYVSDELIYRLHKNHVGKTAYEIDGSGKSILGGDKFTTSIYKGVYSLNDYTIDQTSTTIYAPNIEVMTTTDDDYIVIEYDSDSTKMKIYTSQTVPARDDIIQTLDGMDFNYDFVSAWEYTIKDKLFVIDNEMYVFSDDGETLVMSDYSIASIVNNAYNLLTSTDNSAIYTYANGTQIALSSVTTTGGKYNNIDFNFFPIGEVSNDLQTVLANNKTISTDYGTISVYEDYMGFDYNNSSYFITDIEEFAFDNVVDDSVFDDIDSALDNIDSALDDSVLATAKSGAKIVITIDDEGNYSKTGDDDNVISFNSIVSEYVTYTAGIIIRGNIIGDIYIDGDIDTSSYEDYRHAIYIVSSTIQGNIYIDGSIIAPTTTTSHPLYIANSSTIRGNIYVTGSITGYSVGVSVFSSTVDGDIYVGGDVKAFYAGTGGAGIGIGSSSLTGCITGDIYIKGNVSGGVGVYIGTKSKVNNIYVGGNVSGLYGIQFYSNAFVNDIHIGGDVTGKYTPSGDAYGIRFSFGGVSVNDIYIRGDVTGTSETGSAHGIYFYNSTIQNIHIGGDVLGESNTGTAHGIYVRGSTIQNIHIGKSLTGKSEGTTYGIYFYNTSSTIDQIYIGGNLIGGIVNNNNYITGGLYSLDSNVYNYYTGDMSDSVSVMVSDDNFIVIKDGSII